MWSLRGEWSVYHSWSRTTWSGATPGNSSVTEDTIKQVSWSPPNITNPPEYKLSMFALIVSQANRCHIFSSFSIVFAISQAGCLKWVPSAKGHHSQWTCQVREATVRMGMCDTKRRQIRVTGSKEAIKKDDGDCADWILWENSTPNPKRQNYHFR